MKRWVLVLFAVCAMATSAYAGPEKGTYFSSGVTNTTPESDAYGTVVRPIKNFADGLVLWGGFKTTAPAGPLPWDENAPWWVTIKARLTDKRRTQ